MPCLARWKDKWINSPQFSYNQNQKERRSFQCPDCVPSCNYIKYKIQSSYAFLNPKFIVETEIGNKTNLDKLSLVHVFYGRPFIKEYQQTILSDTYDLLSILGGVFSVMLGISLISVVEFVFYVSGKFMTIWNYTKNGTDVKKVTFVRRINNHSISAMPQQRRLQLK